MSLNGLDNQDITNAYVGAVAEPGGWLLLKYISRDEIELLGTGAGGVAEARDALQKYDEEAPLFGLIRYRRRSILIKYVPDGTSRLAQARATVHFQAISERFYPHDAILPITSATEVNDTTLSQACHLHTASGSLSSATSSLKRRQLGEITETLEEGSVTPSPDGSPAKTITSFHAKERAESFVDDNDRTARPSIDSIAHDGPRRSRVGSSSASVKEFRMDSDHAAPKERKSDDPRRRSLASIRPTSRDMHESLYTFNGKTKYAPRPSLDAGRRPHTSYANQYEPRPVASLPAAMRKSNRKSSETRSLHSSRPNTESLLSEVPEGFPAASENDLRPTSRASTASFGGIAAFRSSTSNSKSGMTPEKARLMKALQLRQKQQNAAAAAAKAREAESQQAVAASHTGQSLETQSTESSETEEKALTESDRQASFEHDPFGPVSESDLSNSHTSYEQERPISTPQSSNADTISTPAAQQKQVDEHSERHVASEAQPQDVYESDESSSPVRELLPELDDKTRVTEPMQEAPSVEETLNNLRDPIAGSTNPQSTSEDEQGDQTAVTSAVESKPEAVSHDSLESAVPDPATLLAAAEDLVDVAPDVSHLETVEESTTEEEQESESTIAAEPEITEIPITLVTDDTTLVNPTKSLVSVIATPTQEAVKPVVTTNTSDAQVNGLSISGLPQSETVAEIVLPEAQADPASLSTQHRAPPPEIEVSQASTEAERLSTQESHEDEDFDAAVTDDSHLDELDSAVVEEAKPVMVSKSPKFPSFFTEISRRAEDNDRIINKFGASLRSVSTPVKAQNVSPTLRTGNLDIVRDSSRSVSGPSAEVTPPKKINVSSTLSQRIKAFEMLSSKTAAPVPPPGAISPGLKPKSPVATSPSPNKVSNFFGRSGSEKTSPIPESNRTSRAFGFLRSAPVLAVVPAASERPRTGSASEKKSRGPAKAEDSTRPRTEPASQRSSEVRPAVPTAPAAVQVGSPKPDSVSVVTRIVREPETARQPASRRPADIISTPRDVETPRKAPMGVLTPPPTAPLPPIPTAQPSIPPLTPEFAKRTSSLPRPLSIAQDAVRSPQMSPPLLAPATLSSQRSSMGHLRDALRTSLPNSDSSASLNGDDKKESHKSRLLRRMSTISATSRKSIQQAFSASSVREESIAEPIEAPPEPEELLDGWVNVQLPDTLLWRRRRLKLTTQGYIVLSNASNAEASPQVRRYHLSDFKAIVIPDRDMEELPYSVILELEDGGSLQCACQDGAEQTRVLQTLKDCYRTLVAEGVGA